MSAYISLLRGINVGGSKILSMDTLCELYTGLGFTHVRTYLQSGNVVFSSAGQDPSLFVERIEAHIQRTCGYHVQVFIRRPRDFSHIVENNPFSSLTKGDTSKLHVSFLYRAPDEAAWARLDVPDHIPDKLVHRGLEIYLYYPNGYAKAKIPTSYLEKALGVPITNRNWNTVTALSKIASEI